MTRKEARDAAFKIMFEYIFQKDTANELLLKYYELFGEPDGQKEYLEQLISGCMENLTTLDGKISENLSKRPINRISKVSLSVLRIAVYEIMFSENIANSIVINEAVELAKTYESPTTGKFVNGVLSSVLKGLDE